MTWHRSQPRSDWAECHVLGRGHRAASSCWALEEGFETDDLAIISEQDILGDRLVRRGRKTKKAADFISELSGAHAGRSRRACRHGIGRFDGLKTIEVQGAPHDCLVLHLCRRRPAVPAGREHRAAVPLRLGRAGRAARQAGRRRLAGARRPSSRSASARSPRA